MIKNLCLGLCCLLCILPALAQHSKESAMYQYVQQSKKNLPAAKTINLFQAAGSFVSAKINESVSSSQLLFVNKEAAASIYYSKPLVLSFSVPSVSGKNYQLELILQDISNPGFSVQSSATASRLQAEAVHYRGYINGDPFSIAGFSVFSNGDIMGLFCNEEGNFNLGKANDDSGNYVVYNSRHLKKPLSFECTTDQLPEIKNASNPSLSLKPSGTEAAPALLCKKVSVYWEGSYKLYSNNFSKNLNNTTNYLLGLFNQVALMYQNEGVLIELSGLLIWTETDPYTTNSSANGLATLKSRWNGLGNNFKGDLCVLVDGAPTNNGGIAYLLDNDYCNRAYAYGYADIYANYQTVPTYSWDVEVLTHEMGHMVGSHHTHWCGWNTGTGGACGAIDDCSPVETGSGCNTCTATTTIYPTPPSGFQGTVMSYCYLKNGIGVNLAYGFGPLPQAAIRASISNAVCAVQDNHWTGAVNTAWETAGNWSCNTVPNANTDVTIPNGVTNYPVINANAECRKLKQQTNSKLTVKTAAALKVLGKN